MGVSHNAAPPRKLAIHQDSELKETTFLGHLAVTGVISGDRAATGRKETLRMMSRCAEKARWAPLLLLLALFGGGRAQTVEVCDLDNIATTGTCPFTSSVTACSREELAHVTVRRGSGFLTQMLNHFQSTQLLYNDRSN